MNTIERSATRHSIAARIRPVRLSVRRAGSLNVHCALHRHFERTGELRIHSLADANRSFIRSATVSKIDQPAQSIFFLLLAKLTGEMSPLIEI